MYSDKGPLLFGFALLGSDRNDPVTPLLQQWTYQAEDGLGHAKASAFRARASSGNGARAAGNAQQHCGPEEGHRARARKFEQPCQRMQQA